MLEIPKWRVIGDWFDNCSCSVACPCTFAEPPDDNLCRYVLFYHIRNGHYGKVSLDGLNLVRVGSFEGSIWAGTARGSTGVFIDERANEPQREALQAIFLGRAGGFPAQVAALFQESELRGVEFVPIKFKITRDLGSWWTEIPGKVKAWAKALTGPTSPPGKRPQLLNAPGSETGPGHLVTWGKATTNWVDTFGYKWQWDGKSSKHIPFDWIGPVLAKSKGLRRH